MYICPCGFPAAQAEPYLLTWHVMGLLAGRTRQLVNTNDWSQGYYFPTVSFADTLPPSHPHHGMDIHECAGVYFRTDGVAFRHGERIGLWRRYLAGESTEALAAALGA